MQSEISQSHKDKYHIFSFICDIGVEYESKMRTTRNVEREAKWRRREGE
jgi:hypothetical protein